MLGKAPLVYEAGSWAIDTVRRELRTRGAPVPVGARSFEIIEALVRSAGELVTKEELMSRIWPGAIVGENTLQVHISAIRKALGPDRSMLKTVSGRGYRLLGNWHVHSCDPEYSSINRGIGAFGTEPATNIPAAATKLVGRSQALQLLYAFATAYRLVTLTGVGGIGKTALAIEASRDLYVGFQDGGWLVELSTLSDPGLLPLTLAGVLGLRVVEEISSEAVARAIGTKRLLLILDNCEHLIDAVARQAEALVRNCPNTTVIATSREPLGTDGEFVYRVPTLDVPASDCKALERMLEHSAVELFVARTRALDTDFSPAEHNIRTIASICRRLDGLPLAIEFAAARAATLGLQQVASGLQDRFALLTSRRRTALPRHQTLRATLDWSYELLPEGERMLLRHLGVFSGGFTLDAANAIMSQAAGTSAFDVRDGVANLVAKSLVALDRSDATSRWFLLETIRIYALGKLTEHNEIDAATKRHATYFHDLYVPSGVAATRLSNDQVERRVREIENVRAALEWSFSSSGDRAVGKALTAAYAPVWLYQSMEAECRERCERALANFAPAESPAASWQKIQLQIALASALLETMGPAERAKALLTEALNAAECRGDLDAQAWGTLVLSVVLERIEYGKAFTAGERLLSLAYKLGEPSIIVAGEYFMGYGLLVTAGRPQEAREHLERALQYPEPPANQRQAFWHRSNDRTRARAMLGRALCILGFTEQGYREAAASTEFILKTSDRVSICRVLSNGMCRVAFLIGDLDAADRAITQMIDVASSSNTLFWQIEGRFLEGKLLVERHEFERGLAGLRNAFAEFRRAGWRASYLEFNGALAEALAGTGQFSEALEVADEAVGRASRGDRDGQMWYLPELIRIRGELLVQRNAIDLAEDCFSQAMQLAREQGALLWELRIALSIARARLKQGRATDARAFLAPVCERIREGFATADTQAARDLLGSLS